MAQKTKCEDATAEATLHMARQYHEAADELYAVRERRKTEPDQYKIDDVVNHLYFQTVELALRAFLRSHGLPIVGTKRQRHELVALHKECETLGLKLGTDDRLTIGNIVGFLDSGNIDYGFRYFTMKSNTVADLSWTREVVADLMRAVAREVEARPTPPPLGKPRLKGTITFSKPKDISPS